ncbi:hypothetical protein FACS1894105_08870 [Clostridia bacterium]|nr:hypothetical protein FACS1894105_08870 [Clostridia bacterium]
MAREFGVKSYKPEEISFVNNGRVGTDDSPWSKLQTKLAKNIILEAYDNASSVEELSLELGVAAPYMEEACDILVNAELMKRVGGKYETDFAILSRNLQEFNDKALAGVTGEIFSGVKKVIEIIAGEAQKSGVTPLGNVQTIDELKWLYLLNLADYLNVEAHKYLNLPNKEDPERPFGGKWSITGYEDYTNSVGGRMVGQHGYTVNNNTGVFVQAYVFNGYPNMPREWAFNRTMNNTGFTFPEEMVAKFAVKKPNTGIFAQSVNDGVYASEIKPVFDNLVASFTKTCESIAVEAKKEVPKQFADRLGDYVNTWELRAYLLNAALADGYLKVPENFIASAVGCWVER